MRKTVGMDMNGGSGEDEGSRGLDDGGSAYAAAIR
jgi:hypothetical protein